MKTKIKKALEAASVNTFEDVCFMYQVPELKNSHKNLKLEAASAVRYRGDYTGMLLIETRGNLFSAIASNILSTESPGLRQKKDALGEIANIICGNVVTSLGRGKLGYKIESPKALNKDDLLKKTGHEKPVAEITLNFNEGRADIKFFIDGYSVPAREKKID
ncbi:MAG: chemotaxis protein CheX [Deltaproteobacteria bacterium]|nr:chemotaxis protein CheX [Deltaproteobacteria bacterium]